MQQYLEINPFDLPYLPLTEKHKLPSLPAVYFAIAETGKVLYIGCSKNLSARWTVHHRSVELEMIGNVRIAWLHCTDETLLFEIEQALIKHFLPNFKSYAERKSKTKKEKREYRETD